MPLRSNVPCPACFKTAHQALEEQTVLADPGSPGRAEALRDLYEPQSGEARVPPDQVRDHHAKSPSPSLFGVLSLGYPFEMNHVRIIPHGVPKEAPR